MMVFGFCGFFCPVFLFGLLFQGDKESFFPFVLIGQICVYALRVCVMCMRCLYALSVCAESMLREYALSVCVWVEGVVGE
jgi:hypothetical protein